MMKEYFLQHGNLGAVFLELIKPNYGDIFRNKFKSLAKIIENDIESASLNPNCSCAQRIRDYVNLYKNDCVDFLLLDAEETNRQDLIEKIAKDNEVKPILIDYRGKVAKTTMSEWPKFYETISKENGAFRNFSVVKEGDDVYVFFL